MNTQAILKEIEEVSFRDEETGDELVYVGDVEFILTAQEGERITRTTEEWVKIHDFNVYDPDGWDRSNLQYSWYEEKITWSEYESRAIRSTCKISPLPTPPKEGE